VLAHYNPEKPTELRVDGSLLGSSRALLVKNDPIGKLARWAITLSKFDYTIEHKSGVANKDADCLSRHPLLPPEEVEEVDTFLLEAIDIQGFQNKDEAIRELVKAVEPGKREYWISKKGQEL